MIAHPDTQSVPGHAGAHKAVLQAGDDTFTVTGFRTGLDAARIGWAITGALQRLGAGTRVTMTITEEPA